MGHSTRYVGEAKIANLTTEILQKVEGLVSCPNCGHDFIVREK